MFQQKSFESFITHFYDKPNQLVRWCYQYNIEFGVFFKCLPMSYYFKIDKCLNLSLSPEKYSLKIQKVFARLLREEESTEIINDFLSLVWPFFLLDVSKQEMKQRLSEIVQQLKIDKKCFSAIIYYEYTLKQQKNKPKKLQIDQIMEILEISARNLDYKLIGKRILNESVGKLLFVLSTNLFDKNSLRDLYKQSLSENRQIILYLFEKIKGNQDTFGHLLSLLTSVQENKTITSKLKNICSFFLLIEVWQKLNQNYFNIKKKIYVQLVEQAFKRIIFLVYASEKSIATILICLLDISQVSFSEQLRVEISIHLLALYRLSVFRKDSQNKNYIRELWSRKFGTVSVSNLYTEQKAEFVTNSQVYTEPSLSNQSQVLGINYFQGLALTMSKKKSITSKRNNVFIMAQRIQIQLRKLDFHKVYLLLKTFKTVAEQLIKSCLNSKYSKINKAIVLIIKMLYSKSHIKYEMEELKVNITRELSQFIKDFSLHDEVLPTVDLNKIEFFNFNQNILNLEIIVDYFINNSEEMELQTLMKLKKIQLELQLAVKKQGEYEQLKLQLKQTFQLKVFYFIYADLKKSKEKLTTILKLLSLRNDLITKQLISNAINCSLSDEFIKSKKMFQIKKESLKNILVQQMQRKNHDRLIFFLNMHINLKFLLVIQTAKKIPDENSSQNYFSFLTDTLNTIYYPEFSKILADNNYLKESLFFIETYYVRKKNEIMFQKTDLVNRAIELYQRLNINFNNLSHEVRAKFGLSESEAMKARRQFKELENHQYQKQLIKDIRKRNINSMDSQFSIAHNNREYFQFNQSLWGFIDQSFRRINELKDNHEITEQLLKTGIKLNINSLFNLSTFNDQRPLMRQTLRRIQQLNNKFQKIIYLQFLVENFSQFKQKILPIYYKELLDAQKYQTFYEHIKSQEDSSKQIADWTPFSIGFMITYFFCKKDYLKALNLFKFHQENFDKNQLNNLKLNHIELQCLFKTMLNFTIGQTIRFIKKLINHKDTQLKGKQYVKCYHKLFRMLFNRYQFQSNDHNEDFLMMFFAFYDNCEEKGENNKLNEESIFYLLRFLVEKFYFDRDSKNYGERIMKYLNRRENKTSHVIPYCTYLIKRLSKDKFKNDSITAIIYTTLIQNPRQCIWTIVFLQQFNLLKSKNPNSEISESHISEQIKKLYSRVENEIMAKKLLEMELLKWIEQNIVSHAKKASKNKKQKPTQQESNKDRNKEPPSELPYIFDRNYLIKRLVSVKKNCLSGKSKPVIMTFQIVQKNGHLSKSADLILKNITDSNNFRIESNTANFFKETSILDEQITYRIEHIAKYITLVEYVDSSGTLASIMETSSKQKYDQIQKIVEGQAPKLLQTYDKIMKAKMEVPLSNVVFKANSYQQWWNKFYNFIRTNAAWSYLGYIIGLGDRHPYNILMTTSSKVIHIDFQYVLDIGLTLGFPEWVPFRLTKSLIEPMGILGQHGFFFTEMIHTAKQFKERDNKSWKALSHFVGIFDGDVNKQILERTQFLNQGGQVQKGIRKVINNATNSMFLRDMFCGWRSHL